MDSIAEYKFADKAFYAVTGDREKIIARVENGRVVYEKGCAGPHKANLTAWIREQGIAFEPEKKTVAEVQTHVAVDIADGLLGEDEEIIVESIPDSELPAFDLVLGTATPGFEEFLKAHRITGGARVALIGRLEKIARR